ncbi:hypothetical protein DdX_20146 [Ditylenchus destructor]|uniref:Uncharacterized protein n=1 Tax=Ditylenchus destructor TaxID=166010 RepID=A0AAD4MLW7_9BILA|nr:hypothetical protein DdX_20146 [Ditylenchus destructor]
MVTAPSETPLDRNGCDYHNPNDCRNGSVCAETVDGCHHGARHGGTCKRNCTECSGRTHQWNTSMTMDDCVSCGVFGCPPYHQCKYENGKASQCFPPLNETEAEEEKKRGVTDEMFFSCCRDNCIDWQSAKNQCRYTDMYSKPNPPRAFFNCMNGGRDNRQCCREKKILPEYVEFCNGDGREVTPEDNLPWDIILDCAKNHRDLFPEAEEIQFCNITDINPFCNDGHICVERDLDNGTCPRWNTSYNIGQEIWKYSRNDTGICQRLSTYFDRPELKCGVPLSPNMTVFCGEFGCPPRHKCVYDNGKALKCIGVIDEEIDEEQANARYYNCCRANCVTEEGARKTCSYNFAIPTMGSDDAEFQIIDNLADDGPTVDPNATAPDARVMYNCMNDGMNNGPCCILKEVLRECSYFCNADGNISYKIARDCMIKVQEMDKSDPDFSKRMMQNVLDCATPYTRSPTTTTSTTQTTENSTTEHSTTELSTTELSTTELSTAKISTTVTPTPAMVDTHWSEESTEQTLDIGDIDFDN